MNKNMSRKLILVFVLLPTMITHQVSCWPSTKKHHKSSKYITKSCQTTLYPDLCNKTLAKYAARIKKSPKRLAMTALLVTINKTRSTSKILRKLSRNRALKQSEIAGVVECVEQVSDSVYELHRSIHKLNHSRKGARFQLTMSDIQTWVSAALTDDDTCMDDFTTRGRIKTLVRGLVLRIARLTSIALAFINNYAAV